MKARLFQAIENDDWTKAIQLIAKRATQHRHGSTLFTVMGACAVQGLVSRKDETQLCNIVDHAIDMQRRFYRSQIPQ